MDNYYAERVKDLEIDVEDARKSMEEAKQQLEDAKAWHNKMVINYANEIIGLDKAKKDLAEKTL